MACGPCCWDAFLEFSSQEAAFWPRVATEHPPPLCWPSGTPLHRPQKPQEGVWETDDVGPTAAFQQVSFSEPPPPGCVLPGPGFPDTHPSQVGAPVSAGL